MKGVGVQKCEFVFVDFQHPLPPDTILGVYELFECQVCVCVPYINCALVVLYPML